jgi:NitT/TauT family transport system substrate-binding protein
VWNGYTINEPLVAEAQGVRIHLIKPSDYGVDMYADCIIASEKTVKEKPDLVRRFLKAAIQGWHYALAHQEEAVKIVLKQDPRLNEDHERRMLSESARLVLARNARDFGIGWMDETVWQKMLEELGSQELLGPHPVILSEVYTNKFLPNGLDNSQWTVSDDRKN